MSEHDGEDRPPGIAAHAAALILEQIDEGICALDETFTITCANPAIAEIFGRPIDAAMGHRLPEILPGFAGSSLEENLEAALRGAGTRRSEWAQGALEVIITPTPVGIWLRFHDVRERRAVEQQLRERDALLTMAESSAGIGIWDIDLATGMVRGTPQFWRIMGLPHIDHAVPIETTRALRLPEDRERVIQGFNDVVGNHAESFEVEYRIRRPIDGEIRWIFGRGRLIRDAAGRAIRYSGVDLDVTERRIAETVLADMNKVLEQRVRERTVELEAEIARRAEVEARLHQAHKLETIGQLTGGIAHDFNNLLTVISGNIESLERHLPDDARLRRFAEAAIHGTERAASLTNRLLAFARRQKLEPKLIDINRLIHGMCDLLHRTLGERITVRLSLADNLPLAFADPNQLETAILNLAVNSHDAMPEGGTLSIETAVEHSPEERPGPGDRFVRITVSDDGTGMDPDTREKAFEPFFTTKPPSHGTGLGLPQVYGFVRQSGGYCRLDSELGIGTRLSLYLPSSEGTEPAPPASSAPPGLARGNGETVLVTEDDPDVRTYSVELLRELGYRVLMATDAQEALRLVASEPEIALLFADVGLPGKLNGRQLAELALAQRPDIKVLLTTGYAADALARDTRSGRDMEMIAKPFTAAALAAKVRRALTGVSP